LITLSEVFNGTFVNSKWLLRKVDVFNTLSQGSQNQTSDLLLLLMMGTGACSCRNSPDISARHRVNDNAQ
jgi:hypothetical protein